MIGITNVVNKNQAESESVNISLITNQISHGDVLGATFTLTYGDFSKTYTWDGSVLTVSVPAHVNYTIAFGNVEGYRKPSDVTYTAQAGNSRTLNVKYETEVVSVTLNSDNGASVSGAKVNINGKQQTWNGNALTQKVPFGTSYTVSVGDMSGFSTPASKSFKAEQAVREVSFTYIASALKVNILSNQSTESSWDPTITNIKATVKYGSTTLQVSNGQQINLPSGVDVTISFPEVEGYLKPSDIVFTHNGGLVEKSGTYQCELLTVNVSADQGSVSGFEVAISKQETVGVATKYTRLEYIESNGSQYIDTGVCPQSENLKISLDFVLTTSLYGKGLFGSQNHHANPQVYSIVAYNEPAMFYVGSSVQLCATSLSVGERHLLMAHINNGTFIIDVDNNIQTSPYSGSIKIEQPIYLFGYNVEDALNGPSSYKLYGCKIYDNNTLVRNYIPALRSDGIAGLYDAVNDAFYASNGSGNFLHNSIEPTIVAKQTSVTGTYKIPYSNSYTVSANSVSGYTTPKSITRIASATSYVVEQKYEVIKVKDLSLFDVYGNPINRSTANCYVVRESGQYKFPLVYGNAIKNGKVNTAAFTNNGGAYSHDFVNGNEIVITQPYIERDSPDFLYVQSINRDDDYNILQCEIIDGEDCKYAQFTIENVPQEGANIVLVLFDYASFVWSWHIWLWPHDLSPVEITNSTGVKYNIMPVNLASKYDSDGVHIKNWFYQWGRPNPMLLPSAWNSTTDHTPGSITKTSKASNLATGIANPSTFYYNSASPYNWFGTKSYYNLWDAACTGTGNSDNDTVKTVYDPCPVGWKVPNGNVFTGFTKTGDHAISNSGFNIIGRFSYGWKFKRYSGDTVGVFFPASGCRDNPNGSLIGVGSSGGVWLSSASTQETAFLLSFASGFIYPRYGLYRSLGASVRPVQDDLTKIDTI